MNHYIGYWKWADYTGRNTEDAYHSNAPIMRAMAQGDVLWLFTRRLDIQTIHIVQRIEIVDQTSMQSPKPYKVSGRGQLQNVEHGMHPDWLEIIGRTITARGTTLYSATAGKLCQRVQAPLCLMPASGGICETEWRRMIG